MLKTSTNRDKIMPRYNRTVGRVNTALLRKFHEIRSLLTEADEQDIPNRYRIAVACQEVRASSEYGKNAVGKLARLLGLDPATVHAYANVAVAWPSEKTLKRAVIGKDQCLSWSHIVELARAEGPDRRRALAAQALKANWTVRKLAAERRKQSTAADGQNSDESSQGDTDEAEARANTLSTAVATVTAQVASWQGATGEWGSQLAKALEASSLDDLDNALTQLENLCRDLDSVCTSGKAVLEACILQAKLRKTVEACTEEAA